jgi:ADP-L-glycero-D-manno-heptose 6-epimerase
MILVTGGAGFIGSNLCAALTARGHEIVVVDRLRNNDKWRNLASHPPARIVSPEELPEYLANNPPIDLVFHLGAISSTTASDGDLVWSVNVDLSTMLWCWCARRSVRFIYASSAATYGDGAQGFEDGLRGISRLKPLNLYGWSKHVFDMAVARMIAREMAPPQWVGLKFFNVYGPNEAHKGVMASTIWAKIQEVRSGHTPRLYRSHHPTIKDGEQSRDFVWVGDVVDVMLWFMDHPNHRGLFNVGTGEARTFRSLAEIICRCFEREPAIDFVDTPGALRGRYQNYTRAAIQRLRAAGYDKPFTSLEDGIACYVATVRASDTLHIRV